MVARYGIGLLTITASYGCARTPDAGTAGGRVEGVRYTVNGNGAIAIDDLLAVARSMPIPVS